jgi:hypothetical protein
MLPPSESLLLLAAEGRVPEVAALSVAVTEELFGEVPACAVPAPLGLTGKGAIAPDKLKLTFTQVPAQATQSASADALRT